MTRQEFVTVNLAADPNMTRRYKAFLKITSPVLVKIVNRDVKKRMEALITAMEETDHSLIK